MSVGEPAVPGGVWASEPGDLAAVGGSARAPRPSDPRALRGSDWAPRPGVVYVVGAGPGDPDLLTVRGRRILEAATTVLYADSLVDPRIVAACRPDATLRPTSGLTLEPIVAEMVAAARRGEVVARLHSGDPSIYGAVAEQLARLDEAAVEWEIVPGVASPMAAAAALGCELTVPEVSQAVVFCRVAGRTPMPAGQDLRAFARPGVSLCIFLSAAYASEVVEALRAAGLADDTPAIVAERVSWPDERFSAGTIADLADRCRALGIRRQALILVGPAFARARPPVRSALYDAAHAHVFRPVVAAARVPSDAAAPTVYALTRDGARVAARIAARLPGAHVHLPARIAADVPGAVAEVAPARAAVARLVGERRPLVLVMATGAAVRLVAPHLADKTRDPAIVVVDDGGRWAVPIAGAHAGGANDLARRVAAALGAEAVVTTASDRRPWPALDALADSLDWRLADRRRLARVTVALLDEEPVGLVQEWGPPFESLGAWPPTLRRYPSLDALRRAAPEVAIVVTPRAVDDLPAGWVVLHPPAAVVGVGCESGATAEEVATAVEAALARTGLSPASVRVLATIDRRAQSPALVQLVAERGWRLATFAADALAAVDVPTPSPVVAEAVGTPSVAEAAALLAAGPGATLVLDKTVCGRATVAVALVAPCPGPDVQRDADAEPAGDAPHVTRHRGRPSATRRHEEAAWSGG